jgi:hypothetical protein
VSSSLRRRRRPRPTCRTTGGVAPPATRMPLCRSCPPKPKPREVVHPMRQVSFRPRFRRLGSALAVVAVSLAVPAPHAERRGRHHGHRVRRRPARSVHRPAPGEHGHPTAPCHTPRRGPGPASPLQQPPRARPLGRPVGAAVRPLLPGRPSPRPPPGGRPTPHLVLEEESRDIARDSSSRTGDEHTPAQLLNRWCVYLCMKACFRRTGVEQLTLPAGPGRAPARTHDPSRPRSLGVA